MEAMAIILGQPSGDLILGTDRADLLRGQDGNDVLRGLAGDDRLLGGEGDDRLDGGGGDDSLDGGFGTDTAVYAGNTAGYLVAVLDGSIRVSDLDGTDGDEGQDRLIGIERIEFADAVRRFDGANNPPVARDDALISDSLNPAHDPHDIVAVPTDWLFV